MRFFIALEIPDNNKKQLHQVQQQVKQLIPQVRLTDNSKLHLTIAFVGEQDDKLTRDLAQVLKVASAGLNPFAVTPAFIDGFPSLHQAHVFWVGVKGDIDKLYLIRERVKDGLIGLGLAVDERRYIPHIAIAKVSDGFNLTQEQEKGLEKVVQGNFEPINIASIKLFESIPDHGFHKHNTLAEVKLNPAQARGLPLP